MNIHQGRGTALCLALFAAVATIPSPAWGQDGGEKQERRGEVSAPPSGRIVALPAE